jgi:hypothetical protein
MTAEKLRIIFVEFIPLWNIILKIDKCIPSTTTNFISSVNTCYMFRSSLTNLRRYIHGIYCLRVISVFNAWRWSVMMETYSTYWWNTKFVVVDGIYLSIFNINTFYFSVKVKKWYVLNKTTTKNIRFIYKCYKCMSGDTTHNVVDYCSDVCIT